MKYYQTENLTGLEDLPGLWILQRSQTFSKKNYYLTKSTFCKLVLWFSIAMRIK